MCCLQEASGTTAPKRGDDKLNILTSCNHFKAHTEHSQAFRSGASMHTVLSLTPEEPLCGYIQKRDPHKVGRKETPHF